MAPSDPNAVGHGLLQPAPLRPSEIADAQALVAEAGWNQTAADWQAFLDYGKVQAIRAQGRVVATAATLPYGAFGWISMVLVTAAFRRQGLAARLMRGAIDDLVDAGLVPVLDATPAGREVYRKLGFADTWGFARLARPGSSCRPPWTRRPTASAWGRSRTRTGQAFAPMTPRRSGPIAAGCWRGCVAACRRRTLWHGVADAWSDFCSVATAVSLPSSAR
jgi:Predicted acetyltransferase